MPKLARRRRLSDSTLVRLRRRASKSVWTPVAVLGGFAAFIGLYSWYMGGVPLLTKVFKRSRAAGVDGRIHAFLDWWDVNGEFPIVIGWMGGVRYPKDQVYLYSKGRTIPGEPPFTEEKPLGQTVTDASTVDKSAHGHKGAVDAYPATLDGRALTDLNDSSVRAKFEKMAKIAKEKFALEWGGDWPKIGKRADWPHFQVSNWASLPIASDPTTAVV